MILQQHISFTRYNVGPKQNQWQCLVRARAHFIKYLAPA